jgi:hypothetical protein
VTYHEWETTLVIDAQVGFTKPARPLKIFAPSPLAAAITGQISCLSFEHGPGRKIQLGPLWLRRAREAAEDVAKQQDELE